MSNPTNPFSWQMPTATDLVTDLPADFEVFGQAVATSMADLLGGTTGQILSKATNADMDFTWVSAAPGDITGVTAGTGISGGGTSGDVTITNDMATTITASGDIVVGTGSGTYDNLPIGTTGQILTADTSVSPYKVKWASPAGGGKVLQVVSATYSTEQSSASATFTTTGLSCAITPSSATSKVLVLYSIAGPRKTDGNLNASMGMRLRRGSSDIQILGGDMLYTATALTLYGTTASSMYLDSPATTSATTYEVFFNNPNSLGSVRVQTSGASSVSSMILLEIGA